MQSTIYAIPATPGMPSTSITGNMWRAGRRQRAGPPRQERPTPLPVRPQRAQSGTGISRPTSPMSEGGRDTMRQSSSPLFSPESTAATWRQLPLSARGSSSPQRRHGRLVISTALSAPRRCKPTVDISRRIDRPSVAGVCHTSSSLYMFDATSITTYDVPGLEPGRRCIRARVSPEVNSEGQPKPKFIRRGGSHTHTHNIASR